MTPLMEQYYSMKAKHPDAILLYRVGDFYETFSEDAVKTSKILGIVLTKRNNGGTDIELAGFPYHSLDAYLPKLVRAGYRVAICEQLEKPMKGKKIVKRGITEVITPGVTYDDKLLDHRKNNFLASIYITNDLIGVAFADVSTGEFYLSQGKPDYIEKLLQSFEPAEIILSRGKTSTFESTFGDQFYIYPLEEWIFQLEYSREKLLRHFKVSSLKGFGVEELLHGQTAAGAIIHYLESTETKNPDHLSQLSRLASDEIVWMDRFTIKNLELVDPIHPEGKSLLQILDKTLTPMGSRLMRKWLVMPLLDLNKIQNRLGMVESLFNQEQLTDDLNQILNHFGDLERLVSKIPLRRITPREINHILRSLKKLSPLKVLLVKQNHPGLLRLTEKIQECVSLVDLISKQLDSEAPNQINKGGIFIPGFSVELDELKFILNNSKDLLLDIQKKEIITTGITNLKIGYNSVFGYFLEVTNKFKNQGLVPEHWIRKQTMSNGERYVTDELKKLEVKILGAEERIIQIEEELFEKLVDQLQEYLLPLQLNAQVIAEIDVLFSFSKTARSNHYCKPQVDDSMVLDIKEARHPVIEMQLPTGDSYIPNDIYLDSDSQQILMITGPNMSGKSAILRQTALISLMAQIGSFVPAKEAKLGYIDRIFTRVGASDNISSGESTFMVEMNETSSILNNLSNRSLILLDEIGRGTSTYDGISLAWAIAEYIHEIPDRKAKTLFATHYHELNELSNYLLRIKNFHVSTQEINKSVLFLRKLVPGGSEHSFGIHVAQMAGMPIEVLQRAEEILADLEEKRAGSINTNQISDQTKKLQIRIIDSKELEDKKLLDDIKGMDIQTMTPIECMMKLLELKKRIENN
ncbi:MAG: DNA mismatch repair protein MutS [Saprospiraceae bacterium]|nr:DNA mismatch repair protein MutS [Saprospiraceae bacterium]MBK8449906.1 DNA mismatch repair protein MutS [Saprospiraceae bacterium]MBK9221441.1 DNA mismatch repair protein MutS [Saprospiraceae bacterium]MBK9721621.1 DNA mismatch repair protein MutS [Saprospiraceae bacterium]